jgi:hypothetical protein
VGEVKEDAGRVRLVVLLSVVVSGIFPSALAQISWRCRGSCKPMAASLGKREVGSENRHRGPGDVAAGNRTLR